MGYTLDCIYCYRYWYQRHKYKELQENDCVCFFGFPTRVPGTYRAMLLQLKPTSHQRKFHDWEYPHRTLSRNEWTRWFSCLWILWNMWKFFPVPKTNLQSSNDRNFYSKGISTDICDIQTSDYCCHWFFPLSYKLGKPKKHTPRQLTKTYFLLLSILILDIQIEDHVYLSSQVSIKANTP